MRIFYTSLYIVLLFGSASCQQSSNNNYLENNTPTSNFAFRALSEQEKSYYTNQVTAFCNKTLPSPAFSGAILVAKNGTIIYENYQGYQHNNKKVINTAETPFHLASISKTFTGTTVLRLWQQGRIGLDDAVENYFPNFPYKGVTVRLLLCHRSGLPSYLNFLDKNWNRRKKATNEDVINYMIAYKPPIQANPNRNFHYCNTNYILLASIVEKITQISFPQYMKDSVFTPLGMVHSFVFSKQDSANYVPTYGWNNAQYQMDHLDFTYGDKNIYSTARDMLLWDLALYQNTFINEATYAMAVTPQSHERKSMHNYGLGWRLYDGLDANFVYHNGKWHGSNTVFTRLTKDTATIIVLGNKLNRNIYSAKKMSSIFSGKESTFELIE